MPEESPTSDYFAVSSGASHACLDLRLPDGKRIGLPYAYINAITFDPETGITLTNTREQVTITGRNLARLFDHLLLYRVRYIQVNLGGDSQEEGVFVETISIEQL
ncbi:hypothetical protein F9K33_08045 [bacterium]|nr:MAG: hypothetical protein F9K33_08045 [bacterium]